jgi:hypothetical protein
MTPITDEQANLLRRRRPEIYDMYRKLLSFASDLDVPECPHQKLDKDFWAGRRCEYCGVLTVVRSAVREIEEATVSLDKALLNGPMPKP